MTDKLPDNARYIVMIKPEDDEDLQTLFNEVKRALRDYPDRPVIAIIHRKDPS